MKLGAALAGPDNMVPGREYALWNFSHVLMIRFVATYRGQTYRDGNWKYLLVGIAYDHTALHGFNLDVGADTLRSYEIREVVE